MSKLRVLSFAISLDGYSAGPNQDIGNPVGVGGLAVFGWQFATRTHHKMHGGDGGATGVDDGFVARGFEGIGAWIMGRNMFGPVRGPWDENWRGWWGDEPPYHAPVFVLTHYPHDPIAMEGGTTFHFITEGFDVAFERAEAAAGDLGVAIAGGASTVRQAFAAGVIDELMLDVVPVLLGAGERLFDGVEDPGLQPVEVIHSPRATHVRYRIGR